MNVRGHVKNGVIVLEKPCCLPEGSEVRVCPLPRKRKVARKKGPLPSLAERFAFLIGKADGLPADFSRNLHHYLYGLPKRT